MEVHIWKGKASSVFMNNSLKRRMLVPVWPRGVSRSDWHELAVEKPRGSGWDPAARPCSAGCRDLRLPCMAESCGSLCRAEPFVPHCVMVFICSAKRFLFVPESTLYPSQASPVNSAGGFIFIPFSGLKG